MKRLVTILFLAVFCLTAMPPVTAAAASGPTEFEKSYCSNNPESTRYSLFGTYPLYRNKKSHAEIGSIYVYRRKSPTIKGSYRWCAYTLLGNKIKGTNHYSKIVIGSRDEGSVRNKPTWHYKSEKTSYFGSGGTALTPGKKHCPAFLGEIVSNGKEYRRKVTGGTDCN